MALSMLGGQLDHRGLFGAAATAFEFLPQGLGLLKAAFWLVFFLALVL